MNYLVVTVESYQGVKRRALWQKCSLKEFGYFHFGAFVKENMFKVLVPPLEVSKAGLDGDWGNLV